MAGWMGKTTTDLNVRAGTGLDYPIIAVLAEGTLFDILDEVGSNWLHIDVAGQEGYVYKGYVKMPRAAMTTAEVAVRESPGETSPIVTALYEDTHLLVFDEDDTWLEVAALGLPGYLAGDVVRYPRIATTTDYVNLRAGASTDNIVLDVLPPGTRVHVWERQGDWAYVADTVRSGHLHTGYIELEDQDAGEEVGDKKDKIKPPAGSLEPPEADSIVLGPNPTRTERQVAGVWNRLGGLLTSLAKQLKIDPGAAVAVLTVESGGRAFDTNGRMIIRFENQIFFDHWGKEHLDVYTQHFQFNASQRWTGHTWRPSPNAMWRQCHIGQDVEWQVLDFARTLDDTAAKLSISMGGAQIMGFNFPTLGYDSVQQMFDAFATDERDQVVGFFSFIQGKSGESKRITALQALDFEAFAKLYNGPGQAATYGAMIRSAYNTYHNLR